MDSDCSLEVEPTRAFADGRDGHVRESEHSRGDGEGSLALTTNQGGEAVREMGLRWRGD